MLHLRVPAGIGDISWCYSKLADLEENLAFYISGDGIRRSLPYVQSLPNVVHAEYQNFGFHQISRTCLPHDTSRKEFLSKASGRITHFALNDFLEKGNRIETFMPELPTNLHYNIITSDESKSFAQNTLKHCNVPFGIFTSNFICATGWNGWLLDKWKFLITQLHLTLPQLTFVLLGAPCDKPFVDDLSKIITPIDHINLAGQTDFKSLVEVLKILKYLVAFPSGIGVLANILNIPCFMFYPQHLNKLIYSWPDLKSIKDLSCTGCIFPEPEHVYEWLFKSYKLHNKI